MVTHTSQQQANIEEASYNTSTTITMTLNADGNKSGGVDDGDDDYRFAGG